MTLQMKVYHRIVIFWCLYSWFIFYSIFVFAFSLSSIFLFHFSSFFSLFLSSFHSHHRLIGLCSYCFVTFLFLLIFVAVLVSVLAAICHLIRFSYTTNVYIWLLDVFKIIRKYISAYALFCSWGRRVLNMQGMKKMPPNGWLRWKRCLYWISIN